MAVAIYIEPFRELIRTDDTLEQSEDYQSRPGPGMHGARLYHPGSIHAFLRLGVFFDKSTPRRRTR